MRVLWFTTMPMPAMVKASGLSGHGYLAPWMAAMLARVRAEPELELGIATAFPGYPDMQFDEDGCAYFMVSQPVRFPSFGVRREDLAKCAAIVRDFKPDLIHVHGTERLFGLLKAGGLVDTPTILSIQGLLGPCSTWRNFFGALSLWDVVRSIRPVELPLRLGLFWQFLAIRAGARREAKILRAVDGLMGRTAWDRATSLAACPAARYFHVGEMLRPEFAGGEWRREAADAYTLIYTNAGHPRRGTEHLLAAVALLREEFPAIRLRLAGIVSTRSGYGRFLRKRIDRLGLTSKVDLLGYLDGPAMVQAMLKSHIFVLASYIENSSNSLGEAMTLGMPCVASYVGGIPSMIRENETGLMYPVGDVPMLASQIRKIFIDDGLACSLGAVARVTALERHDPEQIIQQLLAAYRAVLSPRD